MRKRNEDFSLKELVNIFLPKLWLIMAISLVFGAVMAIYSKYIKDDTYTSTTKIHVIKNSSGVDYGVSDIDFANSYLETYVEALTIPDFLIRMQAAKFIPHTDMNRFPTVQQRLSKQ